MADILRLRDLCLDIEHNSFDGKREPDWGKGYPYLFYSSDCHWFARVMQFYCPGATYADNRLIH